MNFINFWFFKQIFYSIKKLFKHKFLLIIIFGFIIYFLIQSKCFAVEFIHGNKKYNMTVQNPPESILNYLFNNTSYDPEQHDFIIWRYDPYDDTSKYYQCAYFNKKTGNIFKMYVSDVYSGHLEISFNTANPAGSSAVRVLGFNKNGTYTGNGVRVSTKYIDAYYKSHSGNNFTINFLSSRPLYLSKDSDNVLILSYHRTYAPFIVNASENISDLSFAPNSHLLINTNGMIIPPNIYNFFLNYSPST